MKTFAAFIVLFSLALFAASCTDNSIFTTPGTNQTDYKEFTISGSADGLTIFPGGDTKPYRHFEGSGINTPGGASQFIMDYWAIPTGPLTGIAKYGNGTITTANGDKIFITNLTNSTYTINLTDGKVYCECDFSIAGGTGEYANIIGSLHLSATIKISNRESHGEWTGTFHHAKPFNGNFNLTNVVTTGQQNCGTGYTPRAAEGNGIALHVGNCTVELEHCLNFSTGILANGVGNIISSNGDKIQITFDGYLVPIPNTNTYFVRLFGTVAGGTGKYTNASGFVYCTGIQSMSEGASPFELVGAIDW